jgi:hypothetical protein
MKIGIIAGVAKSAQRQAQIFEKSIAAGGHTSQVFARTNIGMSFESSVVYETDVTKLVSIADQSDCEFFVTCNDNLGDHISALNAKRSFDVIPPSSTHKTNLAKLSNKLQAIPSWDHIEDVPKDIPIFVKPISGSGSKGGDAWSYKRFDSIDSFTHWLVHDLDGGVQRFEYAQVHTGVLGRSIFQQYINREDWLYHHYLNDGVAKHWMASICYAPIPNKPCWNKITNVDPFDFTSNIAFGTQCSIQAFDNTPPMLFDFNVRISAYWNSVYQYFCPDFYDVYFGNLLNKSQDKPNFICEEFNINPDLNGPGKIMVIEDYPSSGLHTEYRLEILR